MANQVELDEMNRVEPRPAAPVVRSSSSQDLRNLFVKVRLYARWVMFIVLAIWFLYMLVSPLFKSNGTGGVDVKRAEELLGTLYKMTESFGGPTMHDGIRIGAIQARNQTE